MRVTCVACNIHHDLDPAALFVVRWIGSNRDGTDRWRVVGYCPVCDEMILCRRDPNAKNLIRQDAQVVVYERDVELDDPQRRRRVRLLSDDEIDLVSAPALELLRDEPRFARAVEMLVDRYGTRGGGL